MVLFFDNSRPDRAKRAKIRPVLDRAAIPPAKSYELLSEQEIRFGGDRVVVFDVENHPNYFLVSFKDIKSGKVVCFELLEDIYYVNKIVSDYNSWASLLCFVLYRFLIIGFNSKVYDLPMVANALDGVQNWKLKELSNELIAAETAKFDPRLHNVNHIDIIDVAPITASLKIYGGRLHCKRMQDLPYGHDQHLTVEEAANVRDYNINDLDITQLLYENLIPQIELRESLSKQYQIDLRSKSDAQVAEAVILGELRRLGTVPKPPPVEPGRAFRVRPIPGLRFQTPALQRVLAAVMETDFVIENNGSVLTPKNLLDLDIRIGHCKYQIGNGGLHSNEKSISYYASNNVYIIDDDVASYYPNILINQNLYPEHLGEAFIIVYKTLTERRLIAKAAKRMVEADSLKIVVNGGIGKLSNQYSKLRAPEINTQVTVSGQMYLLMLIEAIELVGIEIISGNTDGIVKLCRPDQYDLLRQVITWWERETGFVTEETRYKSLHSRDVNNYVAVKPDLSTKVKGVYGERGSALNSVLSKNPESLIVSDAVQKFLAEGTPYEQTIRSCRDIKRFVNVRTVKGGAQKAGIYLGKAIRWYYSSSEQGEINYVLSGNKVPKSEAAKPLMELPDELPTDIDYEHYINEALDILYDVGYYKRKLERGLFQ